MSMAGDKIGELIEVYAVSGAGFVIKAGTVIYNHVVVERHPMCGDVSVIEDNFHFNHVLTWYLFQAEEIESGVILTMRGDTPIVLDVCVMPIKSITIKMT